MPEAEQEATPAAEEPALEASPSPTRAQAAHAAAGASDVEVDESLDDNDSAFEDTLSSYTASLASSVVNYPVEHGRRYHAYRSGQYMRPNDEQEMERLYILHKIMTSVTGGLYSAPIDKEKTHRILDIGTGTGIWAMEIGDAFPNASVIGNDLSANMPTFVPPNVKFEVDDVESPWTGVTPYSWIFCRYMAAGIHEWPKLVHAIYENLEPGGWAEFQDFDLEYYSEDGSLTPENPLQAWNKMLVDAARQLHRDPNPGSKLEGWVKEAGFQNVVHKRFRIPIGPWPKDPFMKETGMYNYMQVTQGLEGLSLRLFTGVFNWRVEDIMVLLAKVRRDLKNPNIHSMLDFHVAYGQKV